MKREQWLLILRQKGFSKPQLCDRSWQFLPPQLAADTRDGEGAVAVTLQCNTYKAATVFFSQEDREAWLSEQAALQPRFVC